MHVIVDSTGLQLYGAGQWLEEKHGAKSRRGWRKLHLALDAQSGEIIAHTMTDQDTGDTSQVKPLLDQIGNSIRQFTADGAYDGKPTYDVIINHSVDAAIVIPPRINAVDPAGNRPPGQRGLHIAAISSGGRMKWQASNGYGKRRSRRDRHRAIQIHHRAAPAGAVVSRSADGSRHRLRYPQPHACLCAPEIRSPQRKGGVANVIKCRNPPAFKNRAPTPSVGDVAADGDTFRWVPVFWDY